MLSSLKALRDRLARGGSYPWVAVGAAVVILLFGVVAFLGSQRTTPNTGNELSQLGIGGSSATPSAAASASSASSASPAGAAQHVATPTPASKLAPGAVMVDASFPAGKPTWESRPFNAPSSWSVSYTYDCGGYGGHFTVMVVTETVQYTPVMEHGNMGSGTKPVQGGGKNVTVAIDTTKDCSWHLTARA